MRQSAHNHLPIRKPLLPNSGLFSLLSSEVFSDFFQILGLFLASFISFEETSWIYITFCLSCKCYFSYFLEKKWEDTVFGWVVEREFFSYFSTFFHSSHCFIIFFPTSKVWSPEIEWKKSLEDRESLEKPHIRYVGVREKYWKSWNTCYIMSR